MSALNRLIDEVVEVIDTLLTRHMAERPYSRLVVAAALRRLADRYDGSGGRG